jgi:hypothetical protein
MEMRLLENDILVNLVNAESLKEIIQSGVSDHLGVFPLSMTDIDSNEDAALSLQSVIKSPTPYVYLVRVPLVHEANSFKLVSF